MIGSDWSGVAICIRELNRTGIHQKITLNKSYKFKALADHKNKYVLVNVKTINNPSYYEVYLKTTFKRHFRELR